MPTSAHFIYIPGVLILGLVLGFIWGSRATREQFRLEQQRADERERRKAQRAAEKAAKAETPPQQS